MAEKLKILTFVLVKTIKSSINKCNIINLKYFWKFNEQNVGETELFYSTRIGGYSTADILFV